MFEKEAEEALRRETLRQITLNEVKQQNVAVRELLLGINSYMEEQEGSLLEEEMNRRYLLETTVLQRQLLPARWVMILLIIMTPFSLIMTLLLNHDPPLLHNDPTY